MAGGLSRPSSMLRSSSRLSQPTSSNGTTIDRNASLGESLVIVIVLLVDQERADLMEDASVLKYDESIVCGYVVLAEVTRLRIRAFAAVNDTYALHMLHRRRPFWLMYLVARYHSASGSYRTDPSERRSITFHTS